MKRLILGFIIGAAILVFFLYMGGAKYVKELGQKTEQAGEMLEGYEKTIKKTAREASKVVRETSKAVRDTVKETKEAVEETAGDAKKVIDNTSEKVKDIAE